ncbi:Rho termination factor N-terminal domain-containing protein [Mycoplasma leonicaptivi]|uniref:Rho termination factor N-terminal domain-containing protein n=1 Tax=Mycoplasma leonicaptivi TaxID=36742 RepID=UPI00048517D3|nr:Rho termination factor N-terminal domain-containing protein [Mycoplasma leonicaptivi]
MINLFKDIKNDDINNGKLWSKEKSHFRIWIILFGVILSLIFIFSIIYPILMSVYKHVFIEEFNKTAKNAQEAQNFSASYNSLILSSSFFTFANFLIILFYWKSIYISYKKKDFQFISSGVLFATRFYGILLAIVLIFGGRGNLPTNQIQKIFYGLNIAETILWVITGLVFGYIVSRIRFLFVSQSFRAKIKEQEKNFAEFIKNYQEDPNFTSNLQDFTGNLNSFMNFDKNTQTTNNEDITKKTSSNISKKKQEIEKLSNLSIERLHLIAQKLNIFGYQEMTKDELIEKIYLNTKKTKSQDPSSDTQQV